MSRKILFPREEIKMCGRPWMSFISTLEYCEVIWNRKLTRSSSWLLISNLVSRVHFLCKKLFYMISIIRNLKIKILFGSLSYDRNKNPNLVVWSIRKVLTAWVCAWHSSAVLTSYFLFSLSFFSFSYYLMQISKQKPHV